MLQPRKLAVLVIGSILICADFVKGVDFINTSPRKRRQDVNDVTTVLLVDNHGRSSFGRFLNVKPDLGVITSTARTFIQDGVTTEYATQVLGTTLDHGRLYAHLLTKSSRVLYDHTDPHSKSHYPSQNWNVEDNLITARNFIKNTDYVQPSHVETIVVLPTTTRTTVESQDAGAVEEEILNEAPSTNPRIIYQDDKQIVLPQSNVRAYKINPYIKDLTHENIIVHSDGERGKKILTPSKIQGWDHLPTFTVRNEFSPSGYSFLDDFSDFDSRTERTSKLTTAADRRAKLLFKAGLLKPERRELHTTTYMGFADFTTTVGDTVIVFAPFTSQVDVNAPKITVKPTIKPTLTLDESTIIRPTLSYQKPSKEETGTTHKSTKIIDKYDRSRGHKVIDGSVQVQREDMEAKSSVLAHEQKQEGFPSTGAGDGDRADDSSTTLGTSGGRATIFFSPEVIQPSESQATMLSTPSNEDIAKIFASLQAKEAQTATEPLSSVSTRASTIFFDDDSSTASSTAKEAFGGATTIFFEEDLPILNTIVDNQSGYSALTTEEAVTESITDETSTTTTTTTTTTEKQTTTTEQEVPTTTNEITTTENIETTTTNQEEKEKEEIEVDVACTNGAQIIPTTVYRTLTYLTTFFIPDEDTTSTSINANEVTSTEIGFETRPCSDTIQPASVAKVATTATQAVAEETTTEEETTTQEITTRESVTAEITTESRRVTESEPVTTEETTESGEEIELIFKTLYTTYTYLTTYFQDSTSSVDSRIVVTTNVITSTVEPGSDATEIEQFPSSKTFTFQDLADLSPTGVLKSIQATSTLSDDRSNQDLYQPTPSLDDNLILQTAKGLKTYYTTYTYFTTIFVDGETEISSRTEVFTNYITPTASGREITPTQIDRDFGDVKNQIDSPDQLSSPNVKHSNSYNTTINRKKTLALNDDLNNIITSSVSKEQSYVTLQRGTTEESIDDNNLLDLSDYETISTMVTDVRSSTSEGDRRIIDNLDKRNILDDQIVSESNNDSEIIPSPTLLLQTSYTTFTYFTTMYHGTTSSNIVSRLETITNVVTETLTPTHTLSVEDRSLPITYFTTYTYWTTYYKDGTTKVTSSEVTVSNIVTPTPVITATLPTVSILPSQKPETTAPVQPSLVGEDDLTTYFTTYTYYTTSYIGDSTVLNSRLETITNVLNKTNDIDSNTIEKPATEQSEKNKILKPTGLISTILNTVDNSGTKTIISTGVYGTYIDGVYAQVLESSSTVLTETIQPSSVSVTNLKPTGIVSINKGKIVDAEGVSTLFYTTQAVGTYIDDSYAQVIESTSSLQVDEIKKAALPTDLPIVHKTGLVRLIEGSIVQNKTTTLYQSKVIGTIIDGRYAQIIESTSSFLLAAPSSISPSNVPGIAATPTQAPGGNIAPTSSISPSPVVIEGSLSDSTKIDEESTTEFEEEEEDDEDSSRTRSRLTFQTKKRTFTPVIRPFASRPRPTFAPKRKNAGASTATTVTRSDFTPTVTAVPASKSSKFGGRRSSSNPNQVQPTPTGSRRFGRPKSTSAAGGRRSSSRIQPTSTLGSSRRSGFRTSGISGSRASSLFGSSNRFRIRPTSTLKSGPSSSSGVTQSSVDKEDNNDITTSVTDSTDEEINEDGETILPTTTESSSARRNPLIRLRRPPLNRPVARSTTPRSGRNINRGGNKSASSTTSKPKTTRPSGLLGRSRSNALFPRRGLFTTTTTTTQSPGEESGEDPDQEEDIEGSENDDDVDYDSSQRSSRTAPAPPEKTRPGSVKIRPFSRSRPRRDAYSRYRRPTSRSSTSTTASSIEDEAETETPRTRYKGRYSSRNKNKSAQTTTSAPTTRKRISPSKAQGRTQFTLREKDTQSHSRASYKRPSTRTRATTISSRPKSPRLKTTTEPPSSRRKTGGNSSNRRTNTRRGNVRQQHEDVENYVLPDFDGTITVTHHIPTEVTIPVVNGKITEYKNIITAKTSTEVVGPKGYSTTLNPLGKQVTILLEESTSVDPNGATLITQFFLDETPTTSVIFTPTYIRGRKTSFSHIIPSTVYGVENVIETIQPALAAQAPLANILLSQLLLGGVPPQNYGLNPGAAATPTTEYKTRTTTYVTTVINSKSTVIPLTFRGKEILTTIADTSTQVVTATEFITDTIVVTPTLPTNQLNTLLLPLLQQQLQQQQSGMLQQQQQQQAANLYHLDTKLLHEPQKFNLNLGDDLTVSQKLEEDNEETESEEQETTIPVKKSFKRKQNKPAPAPVPKPKETSVVTLYVSGRTPGEFSTVLSTYVVDAGNHNRRKREIEVNPSRIYEDSLGGTEGYPIHPATRDLNAEPLSLHSQTQSLDSVFGDVGKHISESNVINTEPTQVYKGKSRMKYVKASENPSKFSGNFLA